MNPGWLTSPCRAVKSINELTGVKATQMGDTNINCPDLFLRQRGPFPHPSLFSLREQTQGGKEKASEMRIPQFNYGQHT